MKLNLESWRNSPDWTPTLTSSADSVPPSGENSRPDSVRESAMAFSGQANTATGGRGSRLTMVDD